jgi:hypothetical protein
MTQVNEAYVPIFKTLVSYTELEVVESAYILKLYSFSVYLLSF